MQQTELTAVLDKALTLEAAGQYTAAETLYRAAVIHAPHCHAAWHALGLLAYRNGQLELAAENIAQAISHAGDIALYHRNYGELCRRLRHFDAAVAAGRRATKLAPQDGEAFYNLALALADSGRREDAADCYRSVLLHCPTHGLAWNNLGTVLELLGDISGAKQAYRDAVELNPKHAEAQNNLGVIYTAQGQLALAIECFNAAIRARPSFVEAHCNLSSLKKYHAEDAHVLVLEELAETFSSVSASASIDERVYLDFALGKARDDMGDYSAAFSAYAQGNALKYWQQPYDENSADATLAAFINAFDAVYFSTQLDVGNADNNRVPIFIVGMPRSGTSLLEQILASHPAVFGAGELSALDDVMGEAAQVRFGGLLAQRTAALSINDLRNVGEKYLQRVWAHAPQHRYITDKMPANYFWIGAIHKILPQAKIIHAVRDPLDIGLSCFSRLFDDPSMAFTYDQAVLGRYYRRYVALMQHWQQVLPPRSLLSVRYEDVIAASEQQIKRMLDFIGLPWDSATLNFHVNQRPVKTASLAQVCKPLYADSVGRWRHFAKELMPLRVQLELLREPFFK